MIYGMYLSTMGASVQMARHGTIANNLANATTIGYKPDTQVMQSLPAESAIKGMGRRETDHVLEAIGGGVWTNRTLTNFSRGVAQTTGNPLDVALRDTDRDPTAFFMVEKAGSGAVHYTRNGSFTTNHEGYLVTKEGDYVLNQQGGRIQLGAAGTGGTIHINDAGDVIHADAAGQVVVGRIGIVETETPHRLRKVGMSEFVDEDGAGLVASETAVRSGTLEGSAVVAVTEMTNMIEAHRTYETNMNFLKMQDDTLGQVVSRLGRIG